MLGFGSHGARDAAIGAQKSRSASAAGLPTSPGPAELRATLLSGRRRRGARRTDRAVLLCRRYRKPAEDEAAFIRNYVDTHPPTLGKLPGIRAVMCYFPQGIAAPGIAPADY